MDGLQDWDLLPVATIKPSTRVKNEHSIDSKNADRMTSPSPENDNLIETIDEESQVIQDTLEQCGNVSTLEGLSNLSKTISMLTTTLQAFQKNLSDIVAIHSRGPLIDDNSKSQLEELLQKGLKEKQRKSKPKQSPPPPPPPPLPPSQSSTIAITKKSVNSKSESPLKPEEFPARGEMLGELAKAITQPGGFTLRKTKPKLKNQEGDENKSELDFKKFLRSNSTRDNISPLNMTDKADDDAEISPLVKQIKARKLPRRQSMPTYLFRQMADETNDSKFTVPFVKLRQVKKPGFALAPEKDKSGIDNRLVKISSAVSKYIGDSSSVVPNKDLGKLNIVEEKVDVHELNDKN